MGHKCDWEHKGRIHTGVPNRPYNIYPRNKPIFIYAFSKCEKCHMAKVVRTIASEIDIRGLEKELSPSSVEKKACRTHES